MTLDHDINCGIDPLRLGEDIGCTCGADRELDDGCAFVGTFMGVAQRCDEPPYSGWHDPSSLSFKHAYEHDCGYAVECPVCGDGFDNHDGPMHEAARSTPAAALTPTEIRDLDMALRYALLDHDIHCRAIGMEDNCTCPARGHADRARAIVKRIGAPYRKPSGDYDESLLLSGGTPR